MAEKTTFDCIQYVLCYGHFAILQMFIEYESMKYKTRIMAVSCINWGEVCFRSLAPPKEEGEEEVEEEEKAEEAT